MLRSTVIFLIFLFSCTNKPVTDSGKGVLCSDTLKTISDFKPERSIILEYIVAFKAQDTINLTQNYNKLRAKIQAYRNEVSINDSISEKDLKKAGEYLYNSLLNGIIPYWYGTPWNFDGYSDVPNKGTIACGYFVSTTLKHLGFNLNRFKIAQKYSLEIVELICGKENVKSWSAQQFNEMSDYLKSNGDDVYIVGLSCHVGFLSIENDSLFFIHSSYINPLCVVKEYAELSPALLQSDVFVTGALFTNRNLINKWLRNEYIACD